MDWNEIGLALLGGGIIGVATSLFYVLVGKAAGISGVLNGVLTFEKLEWSWKAWFVIGLIGTGVAMSLMMPARFEDAPAREIGWVLLAGVLVGFGARYGGGCTSGHGVCGISRLSKRSIVGTCVFMFTGAVGVYVLRVNGVVA
ncbi:MAG: YeeE/YedE family protein [Planctomycetota bacterium]|jgi:uncharacterized membrane protein YedE/YeeE